MLLPRLELTALFPAPAAAYVEARAGEIRLAEAVGRITSLTDGVTVATVARESSFAAALIAVGPHQLAALLGPSAGDTASSVLARVAAFAYEPIYTTYLHYQRPLGAPLPMLKLDGEPGQWLFDRGQLGGVPGLAAVVISTDVAAARVEHAVLAKAIDAQLRRLIPELPPPVWAQTIAERRATYACVAGLARPEPGALQPRLYLAGDYTDAEFPATLEAATRSGVAAARQLLAARG
jgi:predicted NAD/FAD-dependent oxidoreductase